jgi:hypothetical protein
MFGSQAKEKARHGVYRELAETLTRKESQYWDTLDTRREFSTQQIDTILGLRDLEKSGVLNAKLGSLKPYMPNGGGGDSIKIGINSDEWNSPDYVLVHHGISFFRLGNVHITGRSPIEKKNYGGDKPVREFISAVRQALQELALPAPKTQPDIPSHKSGQVLRITADNV